MKASGLTAEENCPQLRHVQARIVSSAQESMSPAFATRYLQESYDAVQFSKHVLSRCVNVLCEGSAHLQYLVFETRSSNERFTLGTSFSFRNLASDETGLKN